MTNRIILSLFVLLFVSLLTACGNSLEDVIADVKKGEVQKVKQTLQDSPDIVKESTATGNTVLFEALRYEHEEIVKLAVELGADVNIKDSQGVTPLYFARSPEMARYLIDNGADKSIQTFEGTPLHWAAKFDRPELVQFYIDEGLPIDHKSGRGTTALDLAKERGNSKVVALIESAASSTED